MDVEIQLRKSAFHKRIQSIAIVNKIYKDEYSFLNACHKHFSYIIQEILNKYFFIKINTNLLVEFVRRDAELNEQGRTQFFIQSNTHTVSNATDIQKFFLKNVRDFHINKIEDFVRNGSGWTFDIVIELIITSSKCEHFRSGSNYFKVPKALRKKKAIINVKNSDTKCFKWAVLSALYPVKKNADRVKKYTKFQNKLNFKGIKFPVKLNDMNMFERNNENISINVYAYDTKVSPIRITKNIKEHHVNLLLLQKCLPDSEEKPILYEKLNSPQIRSHYCWIKSLSKLVGKQISKNCSKKFICNICLQFFKCEADLITHSEECKNGNETRIDMPDATNKWLSFKNFHHQLECPFIIYADIESLLKPVDEKIHSKQSYQKHIAFSIGYYFNFIYDSTQCFYASHTGKDCITWFVQEINRISKLVDKFTSVIVPIRMTRDDEQNFEKSTNCFICNKKFLSHEVKVKDHSHFTGIFRGAAHNDCNLNFKESNIVPVVFHNLNYDLHFIIEKIATQLDGPVNIIPINSEKYISFTKKIYIPKFDEATKTRFHRIIQFRFIDSFRFMASSLADLASYLPDDKFHILKLEFSSMSQEKLSLLRRKGVYPYDYITSMTKLKMNELPAKEHFYSRLSNDHISNSDYIHAQNIWRTFNIKNLKEYTELYLKTDVLLLADVFENFRSSCMQIYKLDPAHYFTSPALSWDSMLKFTGVRIELITDVDQLLFIEKGNFLFYSFCT